MDKLLSTIGRSLLISCMVPAIVFVAVTVVLFAPLSPTSFLVKLSIDQPDFGGVLAFILVISFVLAYILMIMNWAVVRLCEGYYTPFPYIRQIEIWKKGRLTQKVINLKESIGDLSPESDLYQRKWRSYVEKLGYLTARFPDNTPDFLPFRFGNIYRALEDYPFCRYGMDGVFFWPRLAKVIPADYAAKVEELNNAIAFLLNSSLIYMLIGIEIILLNVITLDRQALALLISARILDLEAFLSLFGIRSPDLGIFIGVLCFAFSYFFYHAATSTAMTYGHHVRTCYDLFRFDLLKPLQIDLPAALGGEEEKTLWRSVHEFLVLGEGSPYRRKALDSSPCMLIHTAGRLLWTWTVLVFWNSLRCSLEWISRPIDRAQMNAPQAGGR